MKSKLIAIAFALLMLVPILPTAAATHTDELAPELPNLPHAEPTDQCLGTSVPVDILAEINALTAGNTEFFKTDKGVPALCATGGPMAEWDSLIRQADDQLEILRAYATQIQYQVDARLETTLPRSEYPDDLIRPRSVALSERFDGRRIGGFGEWTTVTQSGEPATFALDSETDRNGTRHMMRFGTDEGYARGIHQFLVSPEIDLTVTPVDKQAARDLTFARDRARNALHLLCEEVAIRQSRVHAELYNEETNVNAVGRPLDSDRNDENDTETIVNEFEIVITEDMCETLSLNLGGIEDFVGLPMDAVALGAIVAAYEQAFDDTVMTLPVMQHTAEVDITYRANLANDIDGVRMWLYVGDEAPDRLALFQGDFSAYGDSYQCVSNATGQAQVGAVTHNQVCNERDAPTAPLLETPTPRGGYLLLLPGMNKTKAFTTDVERSGMPYAVTGSTGGFRTVTVNLTDFMGQRVWILFEAKTEPNDRGADIFRDGASFAHTRRFGFEVARVHAETDTFLRNFRVKDIASNLGKSLPQNKFKDATSVRVDVPPGNDNGVVVRVHNAGDYIENGTLTVVVERNLGGNSFVSAGTIPPIPVSGMQPDEVRSIPVQWPGAGVAEGRLYRVSARLVANEPTPTLNNATAGAPERLPGITDPNTTSVRPANVAQRELSFGRLNASALVRASTALNLTAVRADGGSGLALQICKTIADVDCLDANGAEKDVAAAKKGEQVLVMVAVRNDGNAPQDAAADLGLTLDGISRPNAILDGVRRDLPNLAPGETRVLTWTLSAADPGVYELALALIRGDGDSEELIKRFFYVQRSTGLICLDDLDAHRECGVALAGGFEPSFGGRDVTASVVMPDGAVLATTEGGDGGALFRRAANGSWTPIVDLSDASLQGAFDRPLEGAGYGSVRAIVAINASALYLVGDNATVLHVDELDTATPLVTRIPLTKPVPHNASALLWTRHDGPLALDRTGHGFDLELGGAQRVRDGARYGGALAFDGRSAARPVPTDQPIFSAQELTVCTWLNAESDLGTQAILRQPGAFYLNQTQRNLTASVLWNLGDEFGTEENRTLTAENVVLPGRWTHACAVVDNANGLSTLSIVVDGVVANQTSWANGTGYMLPATTKLFVGGEDTGDGVVDGFLGKIDDTVWCAEYAPSAASLSAVARAIRGANGYADAGAPCGDAQAARWTFDEVETIMVLDRSEQGFDLDPGSAKHVDVGARYGGALSFDGASVARAATDRAILSKNQTTMCTWVKPASEEGVRSIVYQEGGLSLDQSNRGLVASIPWSVGAPKSATALNVLTKNQWTHACVVVDNATREAGATPNAQGAPQSRLTLYVDGLQAAQTAWPTGTGSMPNASATLNFGGDQGADPTVRGFRGMIDDTIWCAEYGPTSAATIETIRTTDGHGNAGAVCGDNLAARWTFDEFYYDTTPDYRVAALPRSDTLVVAGSNGFVGVVSPAPEGYNHTMLNLRRVTRDESASPATPYFNETYLRSLHAMAATPTHVYVAGDLGYIAVANITSRFNHTLNWTDASAVPDGASFSWPLRNVSIRTMTLQDDRLIVAGDSLVAANATASAFHTVPSPGIRVDPTLAALAHTGQVFLVGSSGEVAACERCWSAAPRWSYPAVAFPLAVQGTDAHDARIATTFVEDGVTYALGEAGALLALTKRGIYDNADDWTTVPTLAARDGGVIQTRIGSALYSSEAQAYVGLIDPVDVTNVRVFLNHTLRSDGSLDPLPRAHASLLTLDVAGLRTVPNANLQPNSDTTQICDPLGGQLDKGLNTSVPRTVCGREFVANFTNTTRYDGWSSFAWEGTLSQGSLVGIEFNVSKGIRWAIDDVRVQGLVNGVWRDLVVWVGIDRPENTGEWFQVTLQTTVPQTAGVVPDGVSKPASQWEQWPYAFDLETQSAWHISTALADRPVWVANNERYFAPQFRGGSTPRLLSNWDTRLLTPVIDLTNAPDPVVSFRHLYAMRTMFLLDSQTGVETVKPGDIGWLEVQVELRGAECGPNVPATATCWSRFYAVQPDDGYANKSKLGLADEMVYELFSSAQVPDYQRLALAKQGAYWGRTATVEPTGVITDVADTSRYDEVTVTLNKKLCTITQNAEAGDDCIALAADTLQGRRIRFGFHLQTAGNIARGVSAGQNNGPNTAGHEADPIWNHTAVRDAQIPRSYAGEGWYIADFKVLGTKPLGIDLAAKNMTFRTGYEWAKLGVGPGTTVPINVTVENRGSFDALGYTGTLEVRRILNAAAKTSELVATIPLSQQPRLEAGKATNHTMFWNVPASTLENGEELVAQYLLEFELVPIGIEQDEDVTDNIARLGTTANPVLARTSRQFHLDVSVSPENATIDITRYVPIFINNTGNVPLDGFVVERRIQSLGRVADVTPATCDEWEAAVERGQLLALVDCRAWSTDRPVPPGASVSLAVVSDDVTPATDLFWKAPERANFILSVGAVAGEGDDRLVSSVDRRVIAFATYLFDDVEGGVRGEAIRGSWTNDSAWSVADEGFRSDASYAFGDLVLDRYPDNADASMVSPVIDLGSARSARVAFYQRYAFEQGFDGGLLEASVDGGRSWQPLAPMPDPANKHPLGFNDSVPLAASSPLHTTRDPTDVQYAISGDSSALPGAIDGWVLQQFDLTRYGNITRDDVAYERFGAAEMAAYQAQPLAPDANPARPNNARLNVHWDKSWLAGSEDDVRYWEVHDLTNHTIVSPIDDGTFWWSGSRTQRDDGYTRESNDLLVIPVDVTSVGRNELVYAEWWEWTERFKGTDLTIFTQDNRKDPDPKVEDLITAHTFHPAGASNNYRFNLGQPKILEKEGMWMHMRADVTRLMANASLMGTQRVINMSFLHSPYNPLAPTGGDYLQERGFAIDGFRVYAQTLAGGQVLAERTLIDEAAAWKASRVDVCTAVQQGWADGNTGKLPCFSDQGANAARWATQARPEAPDNRSIGRTWHVVNELPGLNATWQVVEVRDQDGRSATNPQRDGETPRAWWTGDFDSCVAGEAQRCPTPGTESRLVTPAFDLSRIAGDDAALSFWHRYAFLNAIAPGGPRHPLASGGVVEIQEFDPQTQTWSGWKQLYSKPEAMALAQGLTGFQINVPQRGDVYGGYSAFTTNATPTGSGAVRRGDSPFENVVVPGSREPVQFLYSGRSDRIPGNQSGWLLERYDVTEYIGKQVRFGFHAYFSPHASQRVAELANPDGSNVDKGGWWIGNVSIVGKVLVGEPTQVRLRASTDANVHDGEWLVDDIGVYGARYRNNVGVFVDGTFGGMEGANATVPVTVRNLGDGVRRDLAVEVRQTNPAVELKFFAPAGFTQATETGVYRVQGLTLGPGQSITIPLRVQVPRQIGGATETELVFQMRELNPASSTDPWGPVADNEVQGLLERVVPFGLLRTPDVKFVATRGATVVPVVGEPVDVVATVRNAGFANVTMGLRCDAETMGDPERLNHRSSSVEQLHVNATYPCEVVTGGSVTLGPGAWTNLTFRATPTQAGFLRFRINGAYVGAGNISEQTAGVIVGASAILMSQTFDDAGKLAGNWTGPGLRWSHARGHDAPGSMLLGVNETATRDNPGLDYSAACDGQNGPGQRLPCRAVSRPIDLHNYTAESSLFLTFWHLDRFAKFDGGQVRAEVLIDERTPSAAESWSASCVLTPVGGYEGGVENYYRPGPPTGQQGPPEVWDLNGNGTAYGHRGKSTNSHFVSPGGRWEETWQQATFDLSTQHCDPDLSTVNYTLVGRTFRLVFEAHLGSPEIPESRLARGPGHGWLIDDVRITPYALAVGPVGAPQRATLLDNTTKSFNIVLTNLGSTPDRVRLSLDAGNSSVPAGSITLPAEAIDLQPKERRIVTAQVTLPRDPTLLPTQYKARFAAQSVFEPNAFGLTTIDLVFAPRQWPELQASVEAPKVAAQEDVETLVPITVHNNGPVASPASRVLVIDEWAGGRKETSIDLPPIESAFDGAEDGATVQWFRWRPVKGSLGEHTITVVVDPDEISEEYTRTNNVVSIRAMVTELVISDLDVTSERALTLRNAVGGVVSGLREADVTRYEVTAGEIVTFELKVANPGRAAATNVDVRAFLGALSLPSKTIPYIAPGGEVGVTFNWLAQKGEHRVEFLVRSEQVELTTANNRNPGTGVTLLTVKAYEVSVDVPALPGVHEPGAELRVNFTVENAGNAGEDLILSASAPAGLRVALPREAFFLRAGEVYEGTAVVVLEDAAVAGEQFITIEAVARENPMKVATGRGSVQVKAFYGGSVGGGLLASAPPTLELPIELVNEGNSLEPWTLAVDLPAGWISRETLPAKVVVPAHDRTFYALHVDVPESTTPGDRTMRVLATMPNGETRNATIRVNVLPLHAATLTLQPIAPKPVLGKLAVPVTIENTGNVEAPFEVLVVRGPAGVELTVEPSRFELAPGETAQAQIVVAPSASVEAGTYPLTSYMRFEGVRPDSREGLANMQVVKLPIQRQDLRIATVEYAPRADLSAGTPVVVKASVVNRGLAALEDVPVHLFVDDVFVAEQRIAVIDAGARHDVTFNWTAIGGDHTLTVVVDPYNDAVETNRDDNAISTLAAVGGAGSLAGGLAAQRGTPGLGVAGILAAIAIALLAIPSWGSRRQRR